MVVDPEQGTIDSPLYPDQVQMIAGVPAALRQLYDAGYDFSIVTNQPAASKGKTTLANLQKVHERVLELAQSGGARILSSHICFHKSEDHCACRKPKTLLLEQALAQHSVQVPGSPYLENIWMVGDGVTDIQAGAALGLKTAFLGPEKCDAYKVFQQRKVLPTFWGKDLVGFLSYLGTEINQGGDYHADYRGNF